MTEQASLGDFDADDEDEEETSGVTLMTPEESVKQGYLDAEQAVEEGSVSREWAVENGYIDPIDERDPEEFDWENYREHVADDEWAYCTAHLDDEQRDALRRAVDDRPDGMTVLNAVLLLPAEDVVERAGEDVEYGEVSQIHQRYRSVDSEEVTVLASEMKRAKQMWRLKRPQPARLLYEFGGVEEIGSASLDQLEEVEGVGPETARRFVEDDVEYR